MTVCCCLTYRAHGNRRTLLGFSRLRNRLLEAQGYQLVMVSTFEWEGAKDKRKLLEEKLREAVQQGKKKGTGGRNQRGLGFRVLA